MRVLLVEDDDMIGRSLMQALEGAGWSVDWVRDGSLAESAMSDGGYTCVLLDLRLRQLLSRQEAPASTNVAPPVDLAADGFRFRFLK